MRASTPLVLLVLGIALVLAVSPAYAAAPTSSTPTYNINTLAGKMASIAATPGLIIRASAFVQEEADAGVAANPGPYDGPITPTYVLSSPLDGTSVAPPAITVNQDKAAAPQNEPAIAVDPNNAQRVVVGMNDYAPRAWSCTVDGTPCSALGDGYSGTYYSNDDGATWCCVSSNPSDLGTLVPGVERLTGGIYDAGGDPALAFNSVGEVFYAGLGFDRTAPPNTVTVSKGTFDSHGDLTWGMPTFINPTTSPAVFNDKEWIAVDAHAGSPFQGRIYVTWTRFVFNPANGRYVQSPIAVAYSSDDGATFSAPQLISGNVLYGQGSRPIVGPDGTVYVFWDASTRLATFDSIYMVTSMDGGVSWSKPVALATLTDIAPPANTLFRVNSFPAAAAGADGTLTVVWNTEANNTAPVYTADRTCAYFLVGTSRTQRDCHNAVVYSTSADGGMTWTDPAPAFPSLEAATRTADGYPVTSSWGVTLNAPAPRTVDQVYPAVAVAPSGDVYVSAYSAAVVSPWLTCDHPAAGVVGRVDCLGLGNYTNNARLDYVITNLSTMAVQTLSTHPINTQVQFGGGFIGDYTDLAIGSDGTFHAVWTDTNNKQAVTWWYGYEFVPTVINQEDIVTGSGST